MGLIYLVRTGNYLPRSKRYFKCECEAIKYIKEVIGQNTAKTDEYGQKLADKDIHSSYSLFRIDKDICPDYERLFKEFEIGCFIPIPIGEDE